MSLLAFTSILFYLLVPPTSLQLLINVKNQGGDVTQENITANVSEDTVTLEFLRLDGVYVSQLVDFTNEVEAVKVVIPGEEELGQAGHQTLCFLTHAAQADFIAPDAMAKLRQKNPGTVRTAEEDRGWRQSTATAWAGRAARLLSAPAARHCGAARDRVYLRAADLPRWPPRPGTEQAAIARAVTEFPAHARAAPADGGAADGGAADGGAADGGAADGGAADGGAADGGAADGGAADGGAADGGAADGAPLAACAHDTAPALDCMCHFEVCVNWYPCGLKYCKGKPQGGLSYRCGIKTCRRCYRYHYYVRRRDACAALT